MKRGKIKRVTQSADWLTSGYSDEELREMKIQAYAEADAQLKGERGMTNEEAITGLKYLKSIHQNSQLTCEALNIAIKAVEKQIPKMPANINYIERPYGVVDIMPFAGKCVCGNFVTAHSDYCQHCGQALDWSEENANNS